MVLLALALVLGPQRAASEGDEVRDRSPIGLALSRDGRWALTANATSDTASLVDLHEGRVAVEVDVGRRPFGVALARDGGRAVVTNRLSGSVTVLEVRPPWLKVAGTVAVGEEPRGVALSADGRRAFVALAGEHRLAVVDLASLSVVASAAVGTEPWHVALTPDGARVAVGNARSRDVHVLDAATLAPLHRVRLLGHNVRQLAVSPDGAWAYVPNIAERGLATTRDNIDAGWVVASRLNRVPLSAAGPREAIALDPQGKAFGDLEAVAVSDDGLQLALAAGGTHELLLLRQPLPFVAFGGPGDHVEPRLAKDPRRFRRVALGGRPVSVAFTPGGETVVVANYLANALQVVDAQSGALTRTITLGGPRQPSLARQGEALFHDAVRSFNQWYSCHSCHTEGHTNGGSFDTFNDGKAGNPKKTLSLRGVTRTAPYTWHGWQGDLRASLESSFTQTLQGPKPTAAELDAVLAFLATNDFAPPRPAATSAAVARGADVFARQDCGHCHTPPLYTSTKVFRVGLESEDDAYPGFNPPSLRNVRARAPFLHDGRARTLRDVLREHDPRGAEDLTPDEVADLVAFLESL